MADQDSTNPEDEYSYDGWLVFNEIFRTDPYDEQIDPNEIFSQFPSYSGGSPNNPDSGFEQRPFRDHLKQITELGDELRTFSENLFSFRYVDEDWIEEWGYDEDANEQLYYQAYHDEVELYWDFQNEVMMLRGNKQLIDRKGDDLRGGLSQSLKLESVGFDFDFFLWILFKEYKSESLSSDLRVRRLTRGQTLGSHEDYLGKHVEVKGTENILKSLMLIAPVLEGKRIESLQGDFIMDKQNVTAEIQYGGKVHIKVSDSPLSSMSDLRRMGITLRFLSELVSLYEYWQDLDKDDRYPPPDFFDDLADNAEEQGWPPNFDPEWVKQEYRRKRESPESDSSPSPAEDAT